MSKFIQRGFHTLFVAVALFAILGTGLYGQITSGTISGTVTDPTAKAIPGAKVDIVDEGARNTRSATTDGNGSFRFPALNPGSYTIRVEAAGFQRLERTGNSLASGVQLALGDLQLTVGAVTETVSVVAQGAVVQTSSSESSALLTTRQLDTIAQKGRVVTNYLLMMPGFATNGGTFDAASSFMTVPNANGLSNLMTAISVDGFQGSDTTSPQLFVTNFNPDAVGEMTVLTNNYQAEYGRNGGVSVNLITKSGTNQYHGTAYWYKRHEMFNANEFFINRSGRPKNIYRFNTEGVSIGGPVLPPLLKRSREKLFFFYNFDTSPSTAKTRVIATLPTLAERGGDFSQTFVPGATPSLAVITNPTTGLPYPGNTIPAAQAGNIGTINPDGQKLLGVFTPPNAVARNAANNFGAFNNDYSATTTVRRGQHVYRIDYRPNDKDAINFRGTWFQTDTDNQMALNQPAGGVGWNFADMGFKAPNKTWVLGWTRIVSPTMVNEFTGGIRRPREFFIPLDDKAYRSKYNFSSAFGPTPTCGSCGLLNSTKDIASFYTTQLILPRVSFAGGGLQNTPNFGVFGGSRYAATEADFVYYWQDNYTISRGKHTYKFGVYYEHQVETEGNGLGTSWNGDFSFDVDRNSPVNTGNPFANALTGNFTRYTEAQLRSVPAARSSDFEWFVQDSYKINKRLTLDIGLRAVWFSPFYAWNGLGTQWDRSLYNRSTLPLLYIPSTTNCGSFGSRCAVDPRNGSRVNPSLQGTYIPNTGSPVGGTITSRQFNANGGPDGFYNNDGMKWQPRFGFAYDPFGKGKTAIRGGFSVQHQKLRFPNRPAAAPLSYDPVLFWGNLATFTQNTNVISPGVQVGIQQDKQAPTVYNMSLAVQQDIGRQVILDVKYLGTAARHLGTYRDYATLPEGTRFLQSSTNPLTGTVLPDSFLRPIFGWNNLSYRESGGSSYYHSLQATANRRFSSGLQFGFAYTFGKGIDYSGSIAPPREGSIMPMYQSARTWSKGKTGFDQTHLFAVNYTYAIPDLSKQMGSGAGQNIVHHVLGNWELSGVTTLSSGTPANIGVCNSFAAGIVPINGGTGCSLSLTDGADLMGGGDGIRANITGDPRIPHGERNINKMFNTGVFQRPVRGVMGNVGNGIVRLPGIVNFDFTMFKRFPLPGEGRNLEFRWETYNIFNHTQFSNMNINATFNAVGAQTNAAFGQATANRPPRIMQVALRIRF